MAFNTQKLVNGIATAIPALMVAASGIFKLTGAPEVVTGLTKAGLGPYISALGVMEIVFAALFVYPKTMKLGVLFLTAYFAGAIAVDLSQGHPIMPPAFILTLVWVAAFIRDRSVFLPSASAAPALA